MAYQLFVIPVEHAECINRVMNQINSDEGDNLSQRYSASGQEPATHLLNGWNISDEERATFPYTKTAPFEIDPEGPAAAFSAQDVEDAVAVLHSVVVDPAAGTMISVAADEAKASACATLGIQFIPIPE